MPRSRLTLLFVATLSAALAVQRGASAEAPAAPPAPAALPGATTTPAHDEEGKRLFQEGLVRYDVADYDQAIALFRQAYEHTRAPALLYNMAQAHRLKGECRKAVDLYRQFARLDPTSPDRERAVSRAAELEPSCPSPREPAVAAMAATASPTTTTTTTTAGKGALGRAPLTGSTSSPRISASPSQNSTPEWYRSITGTTAASAALGTVALGLGAAGGVYGMRADSDADRVSALFDRGGVWNAEIAQIDAAGRSAQQTARVLVFSAALTAVAGVALYVYGRLSR